MKYDMKSAILLSAGNKAKTEIFGGTEKEATYIVCEKAFYVYEGEIISQYELGVISFSGTLISSKLLETHKIFKNVLTQIGLDETAVIWEPI